MTAIKEEELFREIEVLPIDLKTKLLERILNSLHNVDNNIDNLWLKESLQRKKDIENGKVTLINGDDVFKKVFERLES